MAGRSLTGDAPVEVDGILISAPGLAGDLVVEPGRGAAPKRGARDLAAPVPDAFQRAMGRQSMRARTTIRIDSPSDVTPVSREVRRGGAAPAGRPERIRIAVRKPPKNRAQVILSRDEHGITTWHFPLTPKRDDTFTPAGSDLFEIERVPSGPVRRGFGISKILQVVTFPVAAVAGKVAEFEIRKWDHEHHPTVLRAYGPDKSLSPLKDADWKRLEGGRSLLFIHGTFDTITGCFARLPDVTLQELHKRYEGRVIAFDHPTIADSPIDNAREFFKAVGSHKLEIDLVCHSRGGLVSRSIVERPEDLAPLGPNLTVGTAILVGATTNGTDLANVDRWNQMIDRLSTLLSFAPLPAAVDVLESIFGLIRAIAVDTAHDLAGLDAMSPPRPFLHKLNDNVRVPVGTTYRVIDSDYEPDDPDLKAFFVDGLKDDVVFHGANDGMVAIESIEGRTLEPPFPVLEPCFFGKDDGVEHANYFGQAKTSRALLGWLTGEPPDGAGPAPAGPTRSVAAASAPRRSPGPPPRRGGGGGAGGASGGGGGGNRGDDGVGGAGGDSGGDGPKTTKIGRRAIEDLIFHSSSLRRYTQDSPILPDVWFAYGNRPNERIDLLLTPNRAERDTNPPGEIVRLLNAAGVSSEARLAYTQSTTAACLDFGELVAYLLPLCAWRIESRSVVRTWLDIPGRDEAGLDDLAAQLIQFETGLEGPHTGPAVPSTVLWGVRLVGRIQLVREGASKADVAELREGKDQMARARRLVDAVARLIVPNATQKELIFTVSLNRDADVSVYRSVPTVKADAARGLFPVDFKGLAWAVVDSGIDATHPAFRRRKPPSTGKPVGDHEAVAFGINDGKPLNNTRIVETYDFSGVRELTDPRRLENLDLMDDQALAERVRANGELAGEMLTTLRAGKPIRWTRFADLLRIRHAADELDAAGKVVKQGYRAPANEHGTHVAGILAGDWRRTDEKVDGLGPPSYDLIGVCPTLELYDLRVFDESGGGTEFAVLAAIEFLQGLTSEREDLTVQGVNMSFSIRHDVANYACGRTPVCEDVTKLVNSGVVVVAAAGNDGYLRARAGTGGGDADGGYRTVSITDPGNAEAAITVGATHGYRPYAYGVSYFSSRGPTGDGRSKPDLVAPGEKIWSSVPEGGVRFLDGTSMAAPHVSGCAALLMARYHELIGDPSRIKVILTSTASDLGRESYFQGHGLVDVLRAMQSI